tara:strand:- start:6703 stop:7080 length:378 start_codon:yes stop_codon:yes gene_type:complete
VAIVTDLSAYSLAWWIIVACVLLAVMSLTFVWPRHRDQPKSRLDQWFKSFFIYFAVLSLTVPAPVPNVADHYAPALVVWVFEEFFQTVGAPEQSQVLLLGGLLGAMFLAVVRVCFWRARPVSEGQ